MIISIRNCSASSVRQHLQYLLIGFTKYVYILCLYSFHLIVVI